MIALPKDFDVERARRLLLTKLSAIPEAERAALLESVDEPLYAKFLEVGPKTRPATERFVGESLSAAIESNDPAAFDVATEMIGRALPPHDVVETMRELLQTRPWPRLQNVAFHAASALANAEGFELLLAHPASGAVLRKNTFEGGPALALERLRRSPALGPERDGAPLDPWEIKLAQDLVSYLAERGSDEGMQIAQRIVAERHPSRQLRGRAAVSLYAAGRPADLAFLSGFAKDEESLVRSTAIRSILTLDPAGAWERLGGDALLEPDRGADADVLLYELGRDLASVGGAPVQGWARADARFATLARHWLSDRKVGKHAEWVLTGLGTGA